MGGLVTTQVPTLQTRAMLAFVTNHRSHLKCSSAENGRPPRVACPTTGETEARGGWDLPKITQRVMLEGAEVADPPMPRGTSTLIAPQGGGRRGRDGDRGAPCTVGSPGPGWEWGGGKVPLQPSECEPGLAGAGVQRHRGERRKREPNRKEEAEMGVVRERQKEQGRQQESQAVLGTGDKAGQPQRPHIQSSQQGQGEGPWVVEGRGQCEGLLGKQGPVPSHSDCVDGETEAREAKVLCSRSHSQAQAPDGQIRRNPPLREMVGLVSLLSFSIQG